MIGSDHHRDHVSLQEIQRNRELYRVQSTQCHCRAVPDQQLTGSLILTLLDWWTNTDPSLRNVSAEPPSSQILPRKIQLTRPYLDREDRLNLNDGKSRNYGRSWNGHDALNEVRTCFLMV